MNRVFAKIEATANDVVESFFVGNVMLFVCLHDLRSMRTVLFLG